MFVDIESGDGWLGGGEESPGVQQVGSCSQHGDTWLQHINTSTH